MRAISTIIMNNFLMLLLTSYFSVNGQVSSCAIGRSLLLQKSLKISNSGAGQFLDLTHPASCDGKMTGLVYCHVSDSDDVQQPMQMVVRLWRFVKNMSTLQIVNQFDLTLQLSSNGSRTLPVCSNESLKEPINIERGDFVGFLFPPNFGVGLAVVNDVLTEGLYRDKRSEGDYDSHLTPSSDLVFERNLTLNIQIDILPSSSSGFLTLTSTTTSSQTALGPSVPPASSGFLILTSTTSSSQAALGPSVPPASLISVVLSTKFMVGDASSIKLAPSATNPPTIQESLTGSVKLQITPSIFLKDDLILNTLTQLSHSLEPLIIMISSSNEPLPILSEPQLPPMSIPRTASTLMSAPSMDSNVLRLSPTPILVTSNSRQLNPSSDVFSSATTSNSLYATKTGMLTETVAGLTSEFTRSSFKTSTLASGGSSTSVVANVELAPTNMVSLPEALEATTLLPSQTIQGSTLTQTTRVVSPSFSALFSSSTKQKVSFELKSKPSSPTEATTNISPLNTETVVIESSLFSLAETNFPPSKTPIIVVRRDAQNISSFLAWVVAATVLFAAVSGCTMLVSFYIFHYRRMPTVHIIVAKRKALGVENFSYSVKSSDKRGSILPILRDISSIELNVSSDSNNGSNDNVERNSPLIKTSSQQPPNHSSLPRHHVTSNTPSYNSFEAQVSRERELDSIPLLLVALSHTQSNSSECPAAEMNDESMHFPQQCGRVHEYEELTMGKLEKQRLSHEYEEPKSELLDRQEPACDYEKPVSQTWKNLSMPRLGMLPLDDARSAPLHAVKRRNSSACDLSTHACAAATSSSVPANRKPQRIRHYAEFSLSSLQQGMTDNCLNTKQTSICKKVNSFSFVRDTQCHDYEEPFSHMPATRQPLYLVPAPLIMRRRASDYEIPMVTSPIQISLSDKSNVHSPIKKNLFSLTIDTDQEEKQVEGEKEEEESFIELDHNANAKVTFNFDTSNISITSRRDQVCLPENHDSVLPSPAMDGAYLFPPSDEEELTSKMKELSVTMIPHAAIESSLTALDPEQRAVWNNDQSGCKIDVTIKSADFTNSDCEDKLDVLQEISIMAQFRHPNIVKLHGAVNDSSHTILVSEYFPRGDLRKVLVQRGRSSIPIDTPKLLLLYSQQAALGMQYLASKGFVHRDLSATNVFVTKNDICKIGGFDKSRDLYNVNHYIANGGKIQVRWMAPEAVHHCQYSTASDVWSYGCLLYEIWSLGRMPFRDHSNAEVIDKVDSGYRLPPPPGCPLIIYNLMMQCWNPNPSSRPCFNDIIITLLRDEDRVLKIPIKDASTHKSAIVLGASLVSGAYMYADMQKKYDKRFHANRGSMSCKGHDYDHIQEEKFMLAFPTSSADLACESKSRRTRRGLENSEEMATMTASVSLVPQPSLYSEPVVLSPLTSK